MLYFDTSFLAPLFRKEATSNRVEQFLQQQNAGELAISQWTRVEFSNILARDVRMGIIEAQAAIDLDAQFEMNIARFADATCSALKPHCGLGTRCTLQSRKTMRPISSILSTENCSEQANY